MSDSQKYAHLTALAAYRDTLYVSPKLRFLFLELTDACNLSCLHCGSNACPQNHTYLPFSDIKPLLETVAARYDPREIMICLTGGEPMLHPDFYAIAAYATSLGFLCGITTNGTLITPEAAEKIVQSGIRTIGFSLDGLPQMHNWFRNKSDAYERAVAGIRNLLSAAKGRIATQVTTVVHKQNLPDLEAIYALVKRLGVGSWRPINLEPIGRALGQQELLLSGEDYRYLLDYILDKRTHAPDFDVTYGCSHYLPIGYERSVRDYYFICGSGIYVAGILCNGDIYSCLDIERRPDLVQGNIRQDDFIDVWENRFQAFRRDRTQDSPECGSCPDRYLCRGDSAHSWNYDENIPLLCLKKTLENTDFSHTAKEVSL